MFSKMFFISLTLLAANTSFADEYICGNRSLLSNTTMLLTTNVTVNGSDVSISLSGGGAALLKQTEFKLSQDDSDNASNRYVYERKKPEPTPFLPKESAETWGNAKLIFAIAPSTAGYARNAKNPDKIYSVPQPEATFSISFDKNFLTQWAYDDGRNEHHSVYPCAKITE